MKRAFWNCVYWPIHGLTFTAFVVVWLLDEAHSWVEERRRLSRISPNEGKS